MLPRFSVSCRSFISTCYSLVQRNSSSSGHRVAFSFKFNEIYFSCSTPYSSLIRNTTVLQKPLNQLKISDLLSRQKTSKQRRSTEYESDSDSDDEIELIPGSKILQIQTESLRCDTILKSALGLSRNKLEVLFYENRIRVNEEKISKKSHDANIGDVIDLIKGLSQENPSFINVSRVEILKVRPTGDNLILSIRKSKTLLIENYGKHPWVESESEDSKNS